MRLKHSSRLLCAAALVCRVALPESGQSARELFASAFELAKEGDFDAAAAQFEEAYRLSPNYAVLYNLGQAYVALGKPVEAVQAFEKFLELGGGAIDPMRRREVQDLVLLSKKRVGFASFSVEPPNAEVFVDGHSAAKGSEQKQLALAVGTHGVTATASGYVPFIGNLEIVRDKTTTLAITLQTENRMASPKLGQLSIECPVPAATITLDGAPMPCSGPDPVMVAVGRHEITCARDGYLSVGAEADVTDQGVARVVCDLKVDPHLSASRAGILTFIIAESDADVRIDGRRSPMTARLPNGPHQARVRRSGFEDWTRAVTARPGFPETINVRLRPTPEHTLELEQAARSRRNWAYAIGGTGLALFGASVVLYADNSQRYSNWQRDRGALASDIQAQNWSPSLSQRAQTLQTQSASIQGRDDLAVGGALLGGALVSYAVASWLSAAP